MRSLQTTWKQWLVLHPDTLVLNKRAFYQFDSYEQYYVDGSAGILGEANWDDRVLRKELVLGVNLDGQAKSYSFKAIADQKVINDTFARREVVVTFKPNQETGAIFSWVVDGRTLTFRDSRVNSLGIMLIQDQETESTWQAITSQAISGPMAWKTLQRLPSQCSFWFAWSDLHTETELFEPG